MKSFEQMYSEFYGAEIDDAAQIQLYSHSGTELKDFVNYCIEQAGINTNVVWPESASVSGAYVGGGALEQNVRVGPCECDLLNPNEKCKGFVNCKHYYPSA